MTVLDLIQYEDYDYIEWRVISPDDNSEIFFGASASKNGELISLDDDIYDENTEIIRYEKWTNSKKKEYGMV